MDSQTIQNILIILQLILFCIYFNKINGLKKDVHHRKVNNLIN